MNVIIFGMGNYYMEQKEKLLSLSGIKIVAFSDNNALLWKQKEDGVPVISPDAIRLYAYEKIVIMSIYAREIYEQLVAMGVDRNKVVTWERFLAEIQQQSGEYFCREFIADNIEKDVLIVSYDLNYDGASLVAVYAATVLKERGRSVMLAAAKGGDKFIREMVKKGISIVINSALPYILEADREWFREFQVVLVNTFPMIECACEISELCPVIWWVHEASPFYKTITRKYPNSLDMGRFANINIYAVSKNAQYYFNSVYPNRVQKTLSYGIPDTAIHKVAESGQKKKVVFAVIGTVYPLKGQDIFLKAAGRMCFDTRAEFWVIGRYLDKEREYLETILNLAAQLDSVKMIGELSRDEMQEAFSQIDVVVCASHEETVSITITEAMMHGKICITTENTGIADYIQNGKNGFVIPTNDVAALSERMQWVALHYEELENVRTEARKIYEEHFTMETFGANLEKALYETETKWKRDNESEN